MCSPNVKRVVYTSSAASVVEPKEGPYTFTEKDWNNVSVGIVEKEGLNSPGVQIYRASKGTAMNLFCGILLLRRAWLVLAERAAWAFVEHNKGQINFDLVTILPVLVCAQPANQHLRLSLLIRFAGLRRKYFDALL